MSGLIANGTIVTASVNDESEPFMAVVQSHVIIAKQGGGELLSYIVLKPGDRSARAWRLVTADRVKPC